MKIQACCQEPEPDNNTEPDVWWGPHGIDALIWADGVPYELSDPDSPPAESGEGQP